MISSEDNNNIAMNIAMNPYPINNSFPLPSTTVSRKKRRLSDSFQVGPHDVLCCKGKLAYNHEGNQYFRSLIQFHKKSYGAVSESKYMKSQIVSKIVDTIREMSPDGGFVKNIDGVWYEVGDRAAKEKCGQAFRDLLHKKYSSSTKSKARVRQMKRIQQYTIDMPTLTSHTSSASIVSTESLEAEHDNGSRVSVPSVVTVGSPEGVAMFGHRFFPTDEIYDLEASPCTPVPAFSSEIDTSDEMDGDFFEDAFQRDFCDLMGVQV